MPSGKGTYDDQVGRPTKKSVRQEASKQLKTADPRFSPKRGKSKAVASDISVNKRIYRRDRGGVGGGLSDRKIDPRFAPDRKTSKSAQQAIKRRKRRRAYLKRKKQSVIK
jgi:hypothetical protein|tara:strand:- start:822 stop:1151 length:330 start_codon:yes stop_codon:yes gene_type:complete